MPENDKARELADRFDLLTFPVLEHSAASLERLFRRDSLDVDIGELGRVILLDPGLTLSLLARANAIPHGHLSSPLGAVQHAVMMLGLDRVRALYREQPLFSDRITDEPRRRLLDLYSRAHHAAVQATGWAQRRADMNPGEVYVAALLQRLGWMVLWLEHPEDAALTETTLREESTHPEPRSREEIERAHLGFTTDDLGRALTARWTLPPLLEAVLDPEEAKQPRVQAIRLADRLAFTVDWNWYETPVAELIWEVARFLHAPYHRAANAVHCDAALAARAWRAYETLPAAVALPDPGEPAIADAPAELDPLTRDASLAVDAYALAAREYTPPVRARELDEAVNREIEVQPEVSAEAVQRSLAVREQAPEPAHGTLEVRSGDEEETGPAVVRRPETPFTGPEDARTHEPPPGIDLLRVEQLIRTIDSCLTLPDTMHQVLHGLHHYAGLRRVVFAMLTPDRALLRARATLGSHGVESLGAASVEMDRPHLFSTLMEAPQAVWCHADNREQLLPALPENLLEQLDTHQFMAMSVFVNKRPVGLFYGDSGGEPAALEETHYALFQRLCGHAAVALTALSQPRK